MGMHEHCDASLLRAWAAEGVDALNAYRVDLDALNVFPVPDGDTGTNLFLTWEAANEAVRLVPEDHPDAQVGKAMARAALMGARGNSGVIISQVLLGFVEAAYAPAAMVEAARSAGSGLGELPGVNAAAGRLAAGLERASSLAWRAVAEPKEGTVLSVAAAAAAGARAAADAGADLAQTVRAAVVDSESALARTPLQLPQLAAAGVVDAGGKGLVVLLQAMREAVTGEPVLPPARAKGRTESINVRGPGQPDASASSLMDGPMDGLTDGQVSWSEPGQGVAFTGHSAFGPEYDGPEYEVMYLLEGASERSADALRATLAGLGDSVVVVGAGGAEPVAETIAGAVDDEISAGEAPPDSDAGLHSVHVHTDEIGAAIEAGIAAGRPSRIRVTRLLDASVRRDAGRGSTGHRALVVVAHGPGTAQLFAEAGALVVRAPDQGRAATAELLAPAVGSGAAEVVLLPSDKDTQGVAEAAAATLRDEAIRAVVIPTRSVVQSLAAVAVHDPTVSLEADAAAMSRAAGATAYGGVTVAVREAETSAGRCRPGDVLGLLNGDIAVIGDKIDQVAADLVERMIKPTSELVTVILGDGATDATADAVTGRAEQVDSLIEVEVIEGGQPRWPVILGVE